MLDGSLRLRESEIRTRGLSSSYSGHSERRGAGEKGLGGGFGDRSEEIWWVGPAGRSSCSLIPPSPAGATVSLQMLHAGRYSPCSFGSPQNRKPAETSSGHIYPDPGSSPSHTSPECSCVQSRWVRSPAGSHRELAWKVHSAAGRAPLPQAGEAQDKGGTMVTMPPEYWVGIFGATAGVAMIYSPFAI